MKMDDRKSLDYDGKPEDVEKAMAAVTKATKGEHNISGAINCPVCGQAKALSFVVYATGRSSASCKNPKCVRWL